MCGIAGIVSTREESLSQAVIQAMMNSIAHRGPDNSGWKALSGCILGHRRLSIIDLSTGDQPMTEASKRYWIVFNGEIFNYRELRRELMTRGCQFATQSDTEVILQAYAEFGENMLSRLNGQFAFAIWDSYEQSLFAARDRFGEKPFYFSIPSSGEFVFGSEIKALIASGLVAPEIDLFSVDAMLTLLYVPANRTIYQNVYTLPPASFLKLSSGKWQIKRYWYPSYSTLKETNSEEIASHILDLVKQAVHRQMVADVPVGAFLSGGLDSSTVVACMAQETSKPIQTFSVGFGDLINELPYAQQVAEKYHTDHHEIQMNISVAEMLEKMALIYDEPFADSSNIPTFLVAQHARKFVKVALSGDGADEIFGGYTWYQWLLNVENQGVPVYKKFAPQLLSFILRVLVRFGIPFQNQRDQVNQYLQVASVAGKFRDPWQRHMELFAAPRRHVHDHPAVQNYLKDCFYPDKASEGMDRVVDFDIRSYLPGDILVKVDRAALANGLESRAPFLDVDLVEYVLSLQWQTRFSPGQLKSLMHLACNHLWPKAVQTRRKQGFGAPLEAWLKQPDVNSLIHRIIQPQSALQAIFPHIDQKLASLSAQEQWSFLCLGLWIEQHNSCLAHLP